VAKIPQDLQTASRDLLIWMTYQFSTQNDLIFMGVASQWHWALSVYV